MVTYTLADVADLNPDIPEEILAGPLHNNHDSFWLYSG